MIKPLRALPLSFCFLIGQGIGLLLYLVLGKYRRLARRNMREAYGEELPPPALERLLFSNFLHMGANAASAIKLPSLSLERIRKHVRVENFEEMEKAIGRGKGVVMAISHIGNWEMFAQLKSMKPDLPCGAVFQAIRNPHLNRWIDEDRRRKGVVTFDRKQGFRGPVEMLKGGGLVGVLIDQSAGDAGVWTPFFNRLSSTSPLAAVLATRTGAAVVPMAIYTTGFARWRAVVHPEVPYDAEQPDQLTADLNQVLEKQIRVSPADWFWVHNRWKTPNPNFLLARYRRGIYLPPDRAASSLRPFRIVIRSSNWLGDAVMSVPAVRAIKRGRPDAKVTIACLKNLEPMWGRISEVDEVIAFERKESLLRRAARLRRGFDVAILFPNSLRSALEVRLAGIPRRVGEAGHHRRWLLDQWPKPKKRRKKKPERPQHQAEKLARFAEWLGAPPAQPFRRRTTYGGTLPLLGVCPGAEYGPAKRWPEVSFAEVIESISARREIEWRIVGTQRDSAVAQEILRHVQEARIRDLTGKTTLAELIDELLTHRLVLTNDTGTMHLAAMLGIPTVALFGSTEPSLTGPMGEGHTILRHKVECSPCFLRECPLDFRCMQAITPGEVVEAILHKLDH